MIFIIIFLSAIIIVSILSLEIKAYYTYGKYISVLDIGLFKTSQLVPYINWDEKTNVMVFWTSRNTMCKVAKRNESMLSSYVISDYPIYIESNHVLRYSELHFFLDGLYKTLLNEETTESYIRNYKLNKLL